MIDFAAYPHYTVEPYDFKGVTRKMNAVQEQVIKIVQAQPQNCSFEDILIELRYTYMQEKELADVVIIPVSNPDEPDEETTIKIKK